MTSRKTELYLELTEQIRDLGGVPCENAPDVFFLDKGDHMAPEKMRMARILCGSCPLKMLCLEYAIEAGEQDGIWGGMTRNERKNLVRKRVTSGARFY